MSFPPPPHDPQGHGASGQPGFGPPQGGFGPPPGSPPPGSPSAGGAFGPPGSGSGGPGGFMPPGGYGQPGFPAPYGMPPQPPGGGNRGAKVAAIVVGAVLVAAVAVGGVVLLVGGDDGNRSQADAGPTASAEATEPGSGRNGEPTPGAEESAPGSAEDQDSGLSSSPPENMVPFVVLEPGQCFDHPALSSDVSVVETRSCDEPHNGEVITNIGITGTFADEEALRAKVMKLCKADVNERLKSMPSDGKMYYFYAIYPALPTYNLGDDDTISCSMTLSGELDGTKLTAPLPD